MNAVTPPLEVMEPWEKALWESHVGTWKSYYTIRDASGNVVDEHEALNDIQLDWEKNIYSQRNIYRRGDEVEVRRYSAHWDGRVMIIGGKVLSGRARAHDRQAIILRFTKPSLSEETYETIVLIDGHHRGRSMQHYENGVLKRVTSVFGEERISSEPAIDAQGEDLRPPIFE